MSILPPLMPPPKIDPNVVEEIISLRQPRSKTWLLSNGQRASTITFEPCHKRDNTTGKLVDLDTRAKSVGDEYIIEIDGGVIRVPKGSGIPKIYMDLDSDDYMEITLIENGHNPTQTNIEPLLSEGRISWSFPNGQELELIPWHNHFRLFRILQGPQSPKHWKWEVKSTSDKIRTQYAIGQDKARDKLELAHNILVEENIQLKNKPAKRTVVEETWTGKAAKVIDVQNRIKGWQDAEFPVRVDPSFIVGVSYWYEDTFGWQFATGSAQRMLGHNVGACGARSATFYTVGFGFPVDLPEEAMIDSAFMTGEHTIRSVNGLDAASVSIPLDFKIDKVQAVMDYRFGSWYTSVWYLDETRTWPAWPWSVGYNAPFDGASAVWNIIGNSASKYLNVPFTASSAEAAGPWSMNVKDLLTGMLGTKLTQPLKSPTIPRGNFAVNDGEHVRIAFRGTSPSLKKQVWLAQMQNPTYDGPTLTIIYTGGIFPVSGVSKAGFSNSWLVPNGFGERKL